MMGNWDYPPDREEEEIRRRHERVRRKWREKRAKAKPCPNCGCVKLGLNDSLLHRWKRFFLECENCHWCGKSRPTIGTAVMAWNRDNVEKYMYKRGGERTERYLFTELGDRIMLMMVEYLCSDHTETELRELVEKAIRYANGE